MDISRESTEQEIVQWLRAELGRRLNLDAQAVDPNLPFTEFGIDSIEAVGLMADLSEALRMELSPTAAWDHPTVSALAEHLAAARRGRG